ncbi:MAG: cyclic nucleotide-binding domain-containing protein [Burkholderiales bacterium]
MNLYDPAAATAFFKFAGQIESVSQGKTVFEESQKSKGLFAANDKMYLLLDGEVGLLVGRKALGTVKAGEIFGEMGSITGQPRSATAVAKTACRLISLNDKQFQKAIQAKPDFALMLMSVMIDRVRQTFAKASAATTPAAPISDRDSAVFSREQLKELTLMLEHQPPVHYDRNRVIMSEGELAMRMYVVLEGRVAIQVQGNVVQRVGAGGAFGEMALLERARRTARAIAETDCALLAINRDDFNSLVQAKPSFGVSLLVALSERLRNATARLK